MNARGLSVVGHSGAGKTTLLRRLVPLFGARGLRVAVLKHSSHAHPLHRVGSDSARLSEGHPLVVGFGTPEGAQLTFCGPSAFELTVKLCAAHVDLVLVEGWKEGPLPKVEVWRPGLEPPLARGRVKVAALVSDDPPEALHVPCWSPQVLGPELLDRMLSLSTPVD